MNSVAIFTSCLLMAGCSAQRELMTCLRALESYESSSNCPSEATVVSGPVGKKGPKGSIGEKGEKGETFISTQYVEKQEVLEMFSKMEKKLENNTREISKQVSVLEAKLENITDDLQRPKKLQEIMCTALLEGLFYNNRCFRLLQGTGDRISRTEAVSRCVEANCALAEITSDEHQERVAAHIRQTHSSLSSSQRFIWLASTYETNEHPRRLITLRDGRRIPLVNWRNSYPISGSRNTNVLLYVNPDIASNGNGVLNLETSFGGLPLCECSP